MGWLSHSSGHGTLPHTPSRRGSPGHWEHCLLGAGGLRGLFARMKAEPRNRGCPHAEGISFGGLPSCLWAGSSRQGGCVRAQGELSPVLGFPHLRTLREKPTVSPQLPGLAGGGCGVRWPQHPVPPSLASTVPSPGSRKPRLVVTQGAHTAGMHPGLPDAASWGPRGDPVAHGGGASPVQAFRPLLLPEAPGGAGPERGHLGPQPAALGKPNCFAQAHVFLVKRPQQSAAVGVCAVNGRVKEARRPALPQQRPHGGVHSLLY